MVNYLTNWKRRCFPWNVPFKRCFRSASSSPHQAVRIEQSANHLNWNSAVYWIWIIFCFLSSPGEFARFEFQSGDLGEFVLFELAERESFSTGSRFDAQMSLRSAMCHCQSTCESWFVDLSTRWILDLALAKKAGSLVITTVHGATRLQRPLVWTLLWTTA